MEQPVTVWVPSVGLSGMVWYTGDRYPNWNGNLLVGGLSGLGVHRLGFNDRGEPIGREPLLVELRQRIRDIRQGPDGLIYVATDSNPGGVIRLEPVGAQER
jgi:glucose/arabinose dehydrogenase